MRRPLAGCGAAAIAGLLGAGVCVMAESTMASPADLAARLAAARDRATSRITTRGRRTGKPHTVTIWFVVEGTTLYLGTLNARRDWVRNAQKNPGVELDIGGLRVRGRLTTAGDAAGVAPDVGEMFVRKYWLAWIGSWFGMRPDRLFRVDGIEPVAG